MYVGVILRIGRQKGGKLSIPHVCGGDPEVIKCVFGALKYSPCMWG